MPVKKPLVVTGGQIQELQSGDNINIAASDITTGVIATARLASSGTPSSTTFLRGDQTWATPAGGGGGGMTVTIFTSSGTFTNPQTGTLRFTIIGGGGGGGAGRRGASGTQRTGGGGGGGGAWAVSTFMAAELPASIPIWVGANGVGGANNTTNDTNGAAGTSGGNSLVGGTASVTSSTIAYAFGGVGASGGTGSNDGSGQTRDSIYEGMFVITGNSVNQMMNANTWAPLNTDVNSTVSLTTRGGFGGGISNGNTISGGQPSPQQTGHMFGDPVWISKSMGWGANGTQLYNRRGIFISTGGGGGSANGFSGIGGTAGRASGGGGGGGKTNTDSFSNAGGNGGGGIIIIEHWP